MNIVSDKCEVCGEIIGYHDLMGPFYNKPFRCKCERRKGERRGLDRRGGGQGLRRKGHILLTTFKALDHEHNKVWPIGSIDFTNNEVGLVIDFGSWLIRRFDEVTIQE